MKVSGIPLGIIKIFRIKEQLASGKELKYSVEGRTSLVADGEGEGCLWANMELVDFKFFRVIALRNPSEMDSGRFHGAWLSLL